MRSIHRTLCLSLIGIFGCLTVAFPCSTARRYLHPSNYELVKQSDAIVRAVAVDTTVVLIGYGAKVESRERTPIYSTMILFKVREVLKGPEWIDTIVGDGKTYTPEQPRVRETSFLFARRPLRGGPCNTDWYTLGQEYLLFLNGGESNSWFVSGPPFTRIAEPIDDTNAAWYRAVRHYVQVGGIGEYDSAKARLHWLRDAARRRVDRIDYPIEMVEDIDRHFAQPHELKSYGDLIAFLGKKSKRHDTIDVLWAIANGRHPEGIGLVRQLIEKRRWLPYSEPLLAYLQEGKDSSMMRTMIAEYERLDTSEHARWEIIRYLQEVAGAAHEPEIRALLLRSDGGTALGLAEWFILHPHPDATALLRRHKPPEFGLDGIRNALAELGDEEVLLEAFAHQNDRGEYDLGPYEAYYIIARSSHPRADSAFMAVLASGQDQPLEYIVQELRNVRGAHKWPRLEALVRERNLPPESSYWLGVVLEDLERKGDPQGIELLQRMHMTR